MNTKESPFAGCMMFEGFGSGALGDLGQVSLSVAPDATALLNRKLLLVAQPARIGGANGEELQWPRVSSFTDSLPLKSRARGNVGAKVAS